MPQKRRGRPRTVRRIEFFEVSVPLVLLPSRPSAARERLVAHRVMITHSEASQTRHLLMPRAARWQSDGADGAWHAGRTELTMLSSQMVLRRACALHVASAHTHSTAQHSTPAHPTTSHLHSIANSAAAPHVHDVTAQQGAAAQHRAARRTRRTGSPRRRAPPRPECPAPRATGHEGANEGRTEASPLSGVVIEKLKVLGSDKVAQAGKV